MCVWGGGGVCVYVSLSRIPTVPLLDYSSLRTRAYLICKSFWI